MRRFACPGSLALVLIALLFVPLPAFAQAAPLAQPDAG